MTSHTFNDARMPLYTIVGGMMYERLPDLGKALKHWSPRLTGDRYAYFRIYNTVVDERTYRSCIYTKMPLCIFQFSDEAVGIRFDPVVLDEIPSISIWSDGAGCHFEYTTDISHTMKTKRVPHLGEWECELCYKPEITSLPSLQILKERTWWEIVRRFVEAELVDCTLLAPHSIRDVLAMANAFHNRVYDAVNCVHLETVYPDRPERYGTAWFNHPSFEACRIVSLLRYNLLNRRRCDLIAHRLIYDESLSVELREIGRYRVWHNCFDTILGGSSLLGFTRYGTGYSGYPGGMATFLRKLLEYAHLTGASDMLSRLQEGVEWLLLVQREDGSFPFTVPTFADSGHSPERPVTGPQSFALGGAAEAARALLWAFKVYGDRRYLVAAQKALDFINPKPPFYVFRGYGDLRDAGAFETDVTSGIQLAAANLDLYGLVFKRDYLRLAEILGYYVLTWHNWWRSRKLDPHGFIDPMADSFCPHISPWNTALASELYSRLFKVTNDKFWLKLAEYSFARAASCQNPVTGGISEVYNLKIVDEITTMGAESGMVTWGLLDAGCALLETIGEPFYEPKTTHFPLVQIPDVRIGAAVEFIRPCVVLSAYRTIRRCIVSYLKPLMKHVFGVRAAAYFAKKPVFNVAAPISDAPIRKSTSTVSFLAPAGESKGLSFTAFTDEDKFVLRLATLHHDKCVIRIFMPIIYFDKAITFVEPIHKVGETIISMSVELDNGTTVYIEFLDETDGLGVTGVEVCGSQLRCDVSLKAGWQFGGECVQLIRIGITKG